MSISVIEAIEQYEKKYGPLESQTVAAHFFWEGVRAQQESEKETDNGK